MKTIENKIEEMSNHELGTIIKAFANCPDYGSNNCKDCPCEEILCSSSKNMIDVRNYFRLVIAERLLNT